jgi:integrase
MSRTLLKYRGPKKGQAYIRTKRLNDGRELYLGVYDSPESRRAYARWLAKLETAVPEVPMPASITAGESRLIIELILLYTDDLKDRLTRHGQVKKEFKNITAALRNLDEAWGDLRGNEFEAGHLEELQKRLAKADISRGVLNKRITIIKRFFAWCSAHHSATGVRKTLYWELTPVKGLKPGEYGVREAHKIRPVPLAIVEKTLPWLSPVVAAMVRLQLICGMRPDEVCRLTAGEIDRSRKLWVYRPDEHKNAWRGHVRMIPIPGPARVFLEPFLRDDPGAYLFTPAQSEDLRHARGTGNRKTKIYPSELRAREKRKAARRSQGELRFRERYTPEGYWQAIRCGIERAKAAGILIPPWAPNRLRHTASTQISRVLGQQAAQRWLGHENLATTDIYTEMELEDLEKVAGLLESHWDNTILARTPGILNPEQRFDYSEGAS